MRAHSSSGFLNPRKRRGGIMKSLIVILNLSLGGVAQSALAQCNWWVHSAPASQIVSLLEPWIQSNPLPTLSVDGHMRSGYTCSVKTTALSASQTFTLSVSVLTYPNRVPVTKFESILGPQVQTNLMCDKISERENITNEDIRRVLWRPRADAIPPERSRLLSQKFIEAVTVDLQQKLIRLRFLEHWTGAKGAQGWRSRELVCSI